MTSDKPEGEQAKPRCESCGESTDFVNLRVTVGGWAKVLCPRCFRQATQLGQTRPAREGLIR